MKRFAKAMALVLVAVMMLSLCACGAKTEPAPAAAQQAAPAAAAPAAAAPAAAGKITLFQQKAEIADQLKEMAAAYTAETGVEVEVWAQAGDEYYTNLKTSLSSESGPSVFTLNSDAEITEVKDYLADLSGVPYVANMTDGVLAKRDGKVVGTAMTAEGFGLVYNKDLVNAADLTGTDALVKMIETNGKNLTTLGLSKESYFLAGHMFNFPFALQADPVAFCQKVFSGEVKLADVPEFQQYAQILSAIRSFQNNPIEATYDTNCGDFATGKTAMVHQGNWAYGVIGEFAPTFEMGMTGLPVNGNKKICVGVPSVWCVNADAPEEEQQLAKDFLNWLYTSETGVDYMMNKFGFLPVVTGMKNDNLDPLGQAVAEAIAAGDTLPWTFNTEWPAGIIDTDLAPITEQFFTTQMTEAEYLEAINAAFCK